jgi:nucleoside-diphosphate-sugar epimerase
MAGLAPNAVTFTNNVLSSYHDFEAARAAGIRTVVRASSETVLGLPFETPPPYVPVDEDYRGRPETTYSLGKGRRGGDGLALLPVGPAGVDGGAAFLERHGAGRLRRLPVVLWGYVDARDGAQAVRRALEHGVPGLEVFVIAKATG